jgi:hypothetical protein
MSYRVKSQCKGVLEENPYKLSKSDQITQDQSYYEGNRKSKEPTMMIQFARISAARREAAIMLASLCVRENPGCLLLQTTVMLNNTIK